ncbi:MAG: hypothetical protein IPP46_04470 [Bacteroidetes bacterium]|nr:hypothetical protein [Bacteroidota bacterium]
MDRQAAMFAITQLTDTFRTSTNDSVFVVLNSDGPFNASYNKKGSLPFNIDSLMFSAPLGFVYGPYEENGAFRLAKLSAVKMMPDSVKASHILLKIEGAVKDSVLARADSIKKALMAVQILKHYPTSILPMKVRR